MKPNIFKIATKELSQDGFFTWLIQWADNAYSQHNQQLNETAKDFVRLLLGKMSDFQITKVEVWRQWNKIDILVEVNDEYTIVIEDKTDSEEHSDQLERYKQIAINYYKNKNHKLVFVYIKRGNESSSTLKEVRKKSYLTVGRKDILNVFNRREVHNDIFNDFKEYLIDIENETNSYSKFENVTSERRAGEGFFMKLQEIIKEPTDWNYVPNPTGGFLGFWYHSRSIQSIGEIYIQIENTFENEIKLVMKIGSWEPNVDTLYEISLLSTKKVDD